MGLGSGIRDPGSEIRDPEKTYSGSRIPDPGVKKAPDPGSGSAILGFWISEMLGYRICSFPPVMLKICLRYTIMLVWRNQVMGVT
jgi:hypothetical protein